MQIDFKVLITGLLMMTSAVHADTIKGKALYNEQIIAPLDKRFVAVLQDVSQADAPAVELGRIEKDSPGNPPYEFEIEYDPEVIKPGHTYAVRASLFSAKGKL